MTKPHNPWEEFLNNCATGDNHFRSSEYQELIDFIDRIQAENAALKEQVAQLRAQVDALQAESLKWKEACRKEYLSAIEWAGRHQVGTEHLTAEQSKVKVLTNHLSSAASYVDILGGDSKCYRQALATVTGELNED